MCPVEGSGKQQKSSYQVCQSGVSPVFTTYTLRMQEDTHVNFKVFPHVPHLILEEKNDYLVANIALRDEKVAASSFRAFSSFLSFVIVSVTIAFSFSYLFLRLASATSAV